MNTSNKKVIFTADDFALTKEKNIAIIDGLESSLSGTCICGNGKFFEMPPKGEIGIHLNIIEGKSLLEHKYLTKNGQFCHGYLSLLINSKKLHDEIEAEFRAQIERVLACGVKPKHINSHVHVHSIPDIFEIAAKLADEYKIPFIRTQAEKIYFSDTLIKPINLVKVAILNYFTMINRQTVKKYNLQTNDYILGVGYTAQMDENKILDGLRALAHFNNIIVEIIVHPSLKNPEHALCKNSEFREKIKNLGFEI